MNFFISAIRLLSLEEYKKFRGRMYSAEYVGKRWWLDTPSEVDGNMLYVNGEGKVPSMGSRMHIGACEARPVIEFKYPVDPDVIDSEGQIFILDHYFTMLTPKLAILDTPSLGCHVFQKDKDMSYMTDYRDSDIRSFLEEWFEDAVRENYRLNNVTLEIERRPYF